MNVVESLETIDVGKAGDIFTNTLDRIETVIENMLAGNIDANVLLFIAIGFSLAFLITMITATRAQIKSGIID